MSKSNITYNIVQAILIVSNPKTSNSGWELKGKLKHKHEQCQNLKLANRVLHVVVGLNEDTYTD